MTTIKTGNMFSESAEALVNTVNCVGVMGRGVALQFKKRFPENFKAYEKACARKEVVPGKMFVFETGALFPRIIINFPTKRHWRQGSRMEDIDTGLADLVRVLREYRVSSVAVPPLGCGLGGLDWNVVRPKIEAALDSIPGLSSVLFEPSATPAVVVAGKAPNMTPGRAALIALVRRYLSGLLSPFITLLEIQKLLYFLQESGEPLRLNYTKQTYGPYAENLRHVLRAIEGHWLSGYADGGDAPAKELTLLPGAAELANKFLANQPDTQERIERVARLVDGYEDSFGMELLATVHWVAAKEGARTPEETVALVHGWNERKRQFSERQIEKARTRLSEQGWIMS